MPKNKQLADALRKAREKLHLTQAEMAYRARVPLDTWRKWEQGRANPDFSTVAKLIRIFGSDAWPFLAGMGLTPEDLAPMLSERASQPPAVTRIERPEIRFLMPREWEKMAPGADQEFLYDLLPLLRDPAAAGPGREIQESDIAGWIPQRRDQTKGRRLGELVCVRLKGRSMEPVMPDGTVVTVDLARRTPETRRAKPFLLAFGGQATAKLVRRAAEGLEVSAYNREEWPTRAVAWSDVEIKGQIIWWWGKPE